MRRDKNVQGFRSRNQDSEKMPQIFRGVGKAHNGTAVVDLRGSRASSGKHVRKDGGLGSEKTSEDTETDVLCYQNDVPVVEPELLVVFEAGRYGGRGIFGHDSSPFRGRNFTHR